MLCFAQNTTIPLSLKDALQQAKLFSDTQLKPSLGAEFDYYSKHYEDIFGKYLYTFDAGKTGTRYIYMDGSRYQFSSNNSFVMQMPVTGSSVQLTGTGYNDLALINALSGLLGGEPINLTFKVK